MNILRNIRTAHFSRYIFEKHLDTFIRKVGPIHGCRQTVSQRTLPVHHTQWTNSCPGADVPKPERVAEHDLTIFGASTRLSECATTRELCYILPFRRDLRVRQEYPPPPRRTSKRVFPIAESDALAFSTKSRSLCRLQLLVFPEFRFPVWIASLSVCQINNMNTSLNFII